MYKESSLGNVLYRQETDKKNSIAVTFFLASFCIEICSSVTFRKVLALCKMVTGDLMVTCIN